ncbi:hypothetical protein DV919_08365, partial [Campylobacter jejuni]|nr:hypothetical protein [Campylobacter jejuni]
IQSSASLSQIALKPLTFHESSFIIFLKIFIKSVNHNIKRFKTTIHLKKFNKIKTLNLKVGFICLD